MMKMKVSRANCRVVMRKQLGGSVLKGTVFNRWEGISTHLKLERLPSRFRCTATST